MTSAGKSGFLAGIQHVIAHLWNATLSVAVPTSLSIGLAIQAALPTLVGQLEAQLSALVAAIAQISIQLPGFNLAAMLALLADLQASLSIALPSIDFSAAWLPTVILNLELLVTLLQTVINLNATLSALLEGSVDLWIWQGTLDGFVSAAVAFAGSVPVTVPFVVAQGPAIVAAQKFFQTGL
jgi:hypothetical protein